MNWTLHLGHALDVLKTLPAESVNCIVTSPPYFGLRSYCPDMVALKPDLPDDIKAAVVAELVANGIFPNGAVNIYRKSEIPAHLAQYFQPAEIGLEPTPDEFVAALVAVFREVRRVLKDDGTVWLNLGDSYARTGGTDRRVSDTAKVGSTRNTLEQMSDRTRKAPVGLKDKDLIGIPWLVAFALRADGWYLRADIIWHKPNPMPESVTDRPTKSHEYVFLLTKSARYQYDQDAIREPHARLWDATNGGNMAPAGVHKAHDGYRERGGSYPLPNPNGANSRTVWSINTEPSPYDHFAVMPKALARKCIMAGCPRDGVVLDPFAGMATTGVVALEEGRSFVGIELNPKYHATARERLAGVAPLLADEVHA